MLEILKYNSWQKLLCHFLPFSTIVNSSSLDFTHPEAWSHFKLHYPLNPRSQTLKISPWSNLFSLHIHYFPFFWTYLYTNYDLNKQPYWFNLQVQCIIQSTMPHSLWELNTTFKKSMLFWLLKEILNPCFIQCFSVFEFKK